MTLPVHHTLDFERPLLDLDRKIAELRQLSEGGQVSFEAEIRKLEKKALKLQKEIFRDLSRWQVVQLSRHNSRPYTLDYVKALCTDFLELHGDRRYADDPAIITGFGMLGTQPVCIIGHQKGRTTKENVKRNFGMPRPEGYRKALRMMELADRFRRPIITFVDTPGAYPGIGAEERGQAEAIAKNLEVMSGLGVPAITVIIGEGGSGGALGISVSNRLLMMEYSIYSVISPEACSTILYRDPGRAEKAADDLRLTSRDLLGFGICDEVIPEPPGGAHRDHAAAADSVREAVLRHLASLKELTSKELVQDRYDKFRKIGAFLTQ